VTDHALGDDERDRAGDDESGREQRQGDHGERLPWGVQRMAVAAGLGDVAAQEYRRDDRHRHVDQEDRAPADRAGEDPAQDRPAGQAHAGGAAPDRQRPPASVSLGEGVRDERQRARHQPRRSGTLDDSSGDERRHRAGDAARGAPQSEDRQPDEKAAAGAEAVSERAGGQQQGGEDKRVTVDDPLSGREAAAQLGDDRPQCDVHDRGVERDHQKLQAERGETEAGAPVQIDAAAPAGARQGDRVHEVHIPPGPACGPRPLRSR
jgi:hypothetical protein